MLDEHHVEALDDFIDQLIELRERAGDPSLPELRRLSERANADGRRGVVLAQSTTHDILTRKRRCWPKWSWVASYFNACRAAAEKTGLPVEPLGTLEEWNARLRAAKADVIRRRVASVGTDQRHQSAVQAPAAEPPRTPLELLSPESFAAVAATIHRGPLRGVEGAPGAAPADPPAQRGPAEGGRAEVSSLSRARFRGRGGSDGPGGSAGLAGNTRAEGWEPVRRGSGTASLSHQRYLRTYGRSGARLLESAENGDPEAAYRLGVLLGADHCPNESDAWLHHAAGRGHVRAAWLLDTDAPDRAEAAADHAHRLGEEADADDDRATAMVYYERAARAGHPGAAFRLGAIYRDRNRLGEAGYWFNMADSTGSTQARDQFEEIHRGILRRTNEFAAEPEEPPARREAERPTEPTRTAEAAAPTGTDGDGDGEPPTGRRSRPGRAQV